MKWSYLAYCAIIATCIAGCSRDGGEEGASAPVNGQEKPNSAQADANGGKAERNAAPEASRPDNGDASDDAVVYGAESPRDLLDRIAAALRKKDRAQFLACVHPPTASEAHQEEANHAADMMMTCLRARELLDEAVQRFGKQQVQEAAGMAGFSLAMLSAGPTMFEQMAENAEIEVQGSQAVLHFTWQAGLGKPEQEQMVYRRDDGRWYLFKGARVPVEESESVQEAVQMVAAFEKALSASETIEQFRERIAPLNKTISSRQGTGPRRSERLAPELPEMAALSPDAARKAARWALSTGTRLTVLVAERSRPVSIRRPEDIPTEDFRITQLKLNFHHEYSQEDFRQIGAMKDLLKLSCFTTDSVDDSALTHFGSLEYLSTLDLSSTPVTGVGLADLAALERLEHLELDRCPIGDEGLGHIGDLKGLTMLNLSHTQISDAGLEHLKTLANLRSLDLSRTGVTAVGVAELESALTNCRITPTAEELRGSGAEVRTWRDTAGNSFEAELVKVAEDRVALKRTADGKLTTVRLERLSEADQEFIKSAVAAMPDWLSDSAEQGGFSTGFGNWMRNVHALGSRDWRVLVEACSRQDVEWWGRTPRVIELLNVTSGERAAEKALELAEAAENLAFAAELVKENSWSQLDGAELEHKAKVQELMWKWMSEKPITNLPDNESIGWLPTKDGDESGDPTQFTSRLLAVAKNSGTVFQSPVTRRLLLLDRDTYSPLLEASFDDMNMQAQLDFAQNMVNESKDEQKRQEYFRFVLDFIRLDDALYAEAKQEKTFFRTKRDRRVEGVVIDAMLWLALQPERHADAFADSADEIEAATVAGLLQMRRQDSDDVRSSAFDAMHAAMAMRREPWVRQYLEKVPDFMSWGLESERPEVVGSVLAFGATTSSEAAHERALELLKADKPAWIQAGLRGVKEFCRATDIDAVTRLFDHADEEVAAQAVLALEKFEPLPVAALVNALKSPKLGVRNCSFHLLKTLPEGGGLKFNPYATGKELEQERRSVLEQMREKGILD